MGTAKEFRPKPRPIPAQKVSCGGAILDARRAVFLPESGILAVADLHLGYAWVQRRRGVLMPVSTPDSTLTRLIPLLADYRPRTLVVLGDLVHQAVALPALREELKSLVRILPEGTGLVICPGNHDRDLSKLLVSLELPLQVKPVLTIGRYRLHHGDQPASAVKGNAQLVLSPEEPVDVIGHEHPAIRLGDGVATEAKVACFLEADRVLVLPAFSDWAAGCEIRRGPFLGEVARSARFHTAYACLGQRLLPIPLRPPVGG